MSLTRTEILYNAGIIYNAVTPLDVKKIDSSSSNFIII